MAETKTRKPTPAQLAFLKSMPTSAIASYPPAAACVKHGWATANGGTGYGHPKFERTPAGDEIVSASEA